MMKIFNLCPQKRDVESPTVGLYDEDLRWSNQPKNNKRKRKKKHFARRAQLD